GTHDHSTHVPPEGASRAVHAPPPPPVGTEAGNQPPASAPAARNGTRPGRPQRQPTDPAQVAIGQFDKHVWSLWPDFRVVNYRNAAGSEYDGGQGFNLGGRSVFWGGLIPRQAAWELGAWPAPVREYLLGGGCDAAERALSATRPA